MRYYYMICMGLMCTTLNLAAQSIPNQSGNSSIRDLRKIETLFAQIDQHNTQLYAEAASMSAQLLHQSPEIQIQLGDAWMLQLKSKKLHYYSPTQLHDLLNDMSPFVPSIRLTHFASELHDLSLSLESSGHMMLALTCSEFIQKVYTVPDKQLRIYLNQLGYLLYQSGQYFRATQIFQKEIALCQKLSLKEAEACAWSNLGSIYVKFNFPQKALKCFKRSLVIRKHLNDPIGLTNLSINLGSLFVQMQQLDSARVYLTRAKIQAKLSNQLENLGIAHCNLAEVAIKEMNLELAKSELDLALKNLEATSKKWLGHCHEKLGRVYLRLNELALAETHIQQSLRYAGSCKNIELTLRTHETSYNIYVKLNQPNRALAHLTKFIDLRDSLNNSSALSEFLEQEAQQELAQQSSKLTTQYNHQLKSSEEKTKYQRFITYSVAGGLIVALLLGLYLYNAITEVRTQRNKLQLQGAQLSHQHAHLAHSHKEIQDSIAYAQRIQNAILPFVEDVREVFPSSFMIYEPKDQVAGDFYWIQEVDNCILFAVADCTGHGVPGAMVSVICINALNRCVREHGLTDPGEILNKTREIVLEEFEQAQEDIKDGMDIALCRLENDELRYAGANNPLLIYRKQQWIEGKPSRQPIGKHLFPKPFKTWRFNLEAGDKIYLFSDGYPDQFGGPRGKKLKKSKMKEWIEESAVLSMQEQGEMLRQQFHNWRGEQEQIDDVCLMGIEVNKPKARG